MAYTIYISGPMTGLPGNNLQAFHEAEKQLLDKGYKVLNPANNEPTDGSGPRALYLEKDIQHVLQSQGVALLDGWERSPGSRLEVEIALELGLLVAPLAMFIVLGIDRQRERACYDAMIAGIVANSIANEEDMGFFDKQVKKAFDLYHQGPIVQHEIEGKLAMIREDATDSDGYEGLWINSHPLRSPMNPAPVPVYQQVDKSSGEAVSPQYVTLTDLLKSSPQPVTLKRDQAATAVVYPSGT